MADQSDIKKPIAVQVSNLGQIDKGVQSVQSDVRGILNLLNSPDYKRNIDGLSRRSAVTQGNVARIENILSDIQRSLRNAPISFQQASQPSAQAVASQSSISQDNDRTRVWRESIASALREIKDSLDKNSDSIKETSKAVRDQGSKQDRDRAEEKGRRDDTAAERLSEKRAREVLEATTKKSNVLLSAVTSSLGSILGTMKGIARDIFNKWDSQIGTLKESGIGSFAAAELNRMTSRTMEATEAMLGYNVSIAKAIKSTNELIGAGLNPRYVQENNRKLLTSLTNVGLSLSKDTIRLFGQSVVDAGKVSGTADTIARMVNANSENAVDRQAISQYLGSSDFKKGLSSARLKGISTDEYTLRWSQAVTRAKQYGAEDDTAFDIATEEVQAAFGGPRLAQTKNAQAILGLVDTAGTYTGVENLSRDFGAAIKKAHQDPALMRKFDEINASFAAADNFLFLNNVIANTGKERHIATWDEVYSGMYEGMLPRAIKSVANNALSQSIGGVSQELTGSPQTLTQIGGNFLGSIGSSAFGATQTFLLGKIAKNTEKSAATGAAIETATASLGKTAKGGAEATKGLAKWLPKVAKGLGVAGLVAEVGYSAYNGIQAYNAYSEQAGRFRSEAEQGYSQEQQLAARYKQSLASGDTATAEKYKKLLDDAKASTDRLLAETVKSENEAKKEGIAKPIVSTAAGIAGGAGGWLLGLKAGAALGTFGGPIGTIIGGMIGSAVGAFAGDKLVDLIYGTEADSQDVQRKRDRRAVTGHFELGGVVKENQYVEVGEKNKPEAIIPLADDEAAQRTLREGAESAPSSNIAKAFYKAYSEMSGTGLPEEKNGQSAEKTVADAIIAYAKSLIGVPYRSNISYMTHPERGVVCNELVQYAYKKAGIDVPSTSVHYHRQSGKWAFTGEPRPGYVIFSNYTLNNKKYSPPINDYGHMGIVGYGDERIHASSSGKVKLDSYIKDLSNERSSQWRKAGKEIPIYAYFKGAEYGNGAPPVEISSTMPDSPGISDVEKETSDVEMQALQEAADRFYNARQRKFGEGFRSRFVVDSGKEPPQQDSSDFELIAKYQQDLSRLSIRQDAVSDDVLKALLNLPMQAPGEDVSPLLLSNNPLKIYSGNDQLLAYDTLEAGVQDFISNVELALNKIAGKTFKQQLDLLNRYGLLSSFDYSRALASNKDRLADSIDSLNRAVQENTRARRGVSAAPATVIQGRRY